MTPLLVITSALLPMPPTLLTIGAAFLLTLVAHICARLLSKHIKGLPVVITALALVILFLYGLRWDYERYYMAAKPIFDHLLGYVTVLLAIPLATMDFKHLPVKQLSIVLLVASFIGAALPMGLAYILSLDYGTVLAFATRSVTTPIGLSVAEIIGAPLAMANLIIIVSGVVGGTLGRFIFIGINDERAKGLALGLVAHAFGTVEAWQISPNAGRYAAFGLAVNGLLTAIWLPLVFAWLS